MEKKVFDIRERSFRFSVEIVKLVKDLPRNTLKFVIGDQLLRSGTAIGANIEEAQNSGTKKEFIRGMTIALKEARETDYWLRLVKETGLVPKGKLEDLIEENREIVKILITIIKKSKQKN